jgi:uncharacterized membrane protein YoaK (UPF0700 family)
MPATVTASEIRVAWDRVDPNSDPNAEPQRQRHTLLRRVLLNDPDHGTLPILLVGLTIVTGLVDAVSILTLGRVFVANMTGNVVFIGFALAGAPGFSLSASLIALAGFLIGAGLAGPAIQRHGGDRIIVLRAATLSELGLVLIAFLVAAGVGQPFGGGSRDVIAALIALAMGIQNAMARRLAVPDLTTTVLTMTLTGIAADLRQSRPAPLLRRVLAVTAMLCGGLAGAELVLHVNAASALGVATGILAVVLAGSAVAARHR